MKTFISLSPIFTIFFTPNESPQFYIYIGQNVLGYGEATKKSPSQKGLFLILKNSNTCWTIQGSCAPRGDLEIQEEFYSVAPRSQDVTVHDSQRGEENTS